MALSGRVGAGAQQALQDLVQQRMLEEEAAARLQQQEFQNQMAQRRLTNEEAEAAQRAAWQTAQLSMQQRAAKLDEAKIVAELLQRQYDPTTGRTVSIPEEQYKALEGTPLAGIARRQESLPARNLLTELAPLAAPIYPAANAAGRGTPGPALGPTIEEQPRLLTELIPSGEQLAKRRETVKKEEGERAVRELGNIPGLTPAVQRAYRSGAIKPEDVKPEHLETDVERRARLQEESNRRIRETIAGRAPREPDQYLLTKDGEHRIVTGAREANRLMGEGWSPTTAAAASAASAKGRGGAGSEWQKASASSLAVLDEVKALSDILNTTSETSYGGFGGLVAKLEGTQERMQASVGLNRSVQDYQALIDAFTPLVARALGHVGVLTEQDVQSARQVFPQLGDSKELATDKLNRAYKLIESMSPEEWDTLPKMPDGSEPRPWKVRRNVGGGRVGGGGGGAGGGGAGEPLSADPLNIRGKP